MWPKVVGCGRPSCRRQCIDRGRDAAQVVRFRTHLQRASECVQQMQDAALLARQRSACDVLFVELQDSRRERMVRLWPRAGRATKNAPDGDENALQTLVRRLASASKQRVLLLPVVATILDVFRNCEMGEAALGEWSPVS